jgi:hypothetical protein
MGIALFTLIEEEIFYAEIYSDDQPCQRWTKIQHFKDLSLRRRSYYALCETTDSRIQLL